MTEGTYRRVFLASGHMTDLPDRAEPRFPPVKEEAVRAAIAAQLDAWKMGEGDLALCGGARGTDMLFAELAAQRGAHVRILLAHEPEEFIRRSVHIDGTDWRRRFNKLHGACEDPRKTTYECLVAPRVLGPLADGENAYERANTWLLDTAKKEAAVAEGLFLLLVWDERPAGDGPGGTSDLAARATEDLGATRAVINPTAIEPFPRDVHLARENAPKRILSLDGGGVRGILTLEYLKRLERLLEARHGRKVLLCEYFDLIAGTSTGSIIAAALANGMTAGEIETAYDSLAQSVFQRRWYRLGIFGAKFDADDLKKALRDLFGGLSIGSRKLRTGLLVVTKRIDSGSQWPISNNPRATYFHFRPGSTSIPNGSYPLRKVVRASTAAPHYFGPEEIEIHPGQKPGDFVDGGVSTANNPTFEALKLVTLEGFGLRWKTGADKLLIVSCGTGAANPASETSSIAGKHALVALTSIMNDCSEMIETLMQWISKSDTGRKIDSDVGTLANDHLAGEPLATYQRYNVELDAKWLKKELDVELSAEEVGKLVEMDQPGNMPMLKKLGEKSAEVHMSEAHLPRGFDLQ